MKPKPRLPWPQPGDPDRLVSKQTICQQMDISEAHFDRLADAPDAILVGERIRRWWAQSWNQWLLRRTRPAPYFAPEPRRPRKRALNKPQSAAQQAVPPRQPELSAQSESTSAPHAAPREKPAPARPSAMAPKLKQLPRRKSRRRKRRYGSSPAPPGRPRPTEKDLDRWLIRS
jgi:hypothetical protein